MGEYFQDHWIKTYKPSLWFRIKSIFTKTRISVDIGSQETCVKYKVVNGKFYIIDSYVLNNAVSPQKRIKK